MFFDIIRASQGDKVFFGHLSLSWGVMADTDIQSDKYRLIGRYKYYLAGLIRIINVMKYHGHLYFLPEESDVKASYEISDNYEINKAEREKIRLERLNKKDQNKVLKTEDSSSTLCDEASDSMTKYSINHLD